jgi:hypothetical protein
MPAYLFIKILIYKKKTKIIVNPFVLFFIFPLYLKLKNNIQINLIPSKYISRLCLIIITTIINIPLFGQIKEPKVSPGKTIILNEEKLKTNKDSLKKQVKIYPITDYKIFNIQKDSVHADTILNIRKYYKFNPFFADDFLFLPFHNYGQPVTPLSFNRIKNDILPGFIGSAKLSAYWQHRQVPFFQTPSPYSDVSYLNGVSQGQILSSVFATNINPNLNISVTYYGLSSLGLYKHAIADGQRFSGSLHYASKNKKYQLYFYYYTFNRNNEENGGIKDVNQFENGGETFKDRSRIDVNINDAESFLKHQRLFARQEYGIIKNRFYIVSKSFYRNNVYIFSETKPNELFGETTDAKTIKDSIYLNQFEQFGGLKFSYKNLKIETGLRYVYQYYHLDSLKILDNKTYPKDLTYKDLSLDSKISFKLKKLDIHTQLKAGFTSHIAGYVFDAYTRYRFSPEMSIKAAINSSATRPDFKYILYQSGYNKYNWYHPEFKNELIQNIRVEIKHKKWGNLRLKQTMVNNYTYFGKDSLPHQNENGIKYTSLKFSKDFRYRKWGLANDIQLQQVIDGKELYSLPSYVFRSSLYYSDYFYHKNLYIQTGFTFKYFESFYPRAYNPLISDFILQDYKKTGNYPLIDYFFNFKVKRFRFYFKLEHLNALFEYQKPDYYAAPLQPIRDFSIRFGLRWIWLN